MYSYVFASLLATVCLLQAPLCECFFLESFLQGIPGLDGTTRSEKSSLSRLNPILPGITTTASGDQKKDVPKASIDGQPLVDIPCELDSIGNETSSLTVTIEKPTNGLTASRSNKKPNQSLKLSDLFRWKSIFDHLGNGDQVAQELTGVGRNNKFANYALTDDELNGEPNGKDISIIVVENQPTTTTTTTTTITPTLTSEAGVITVNNNLQNCINKKNCNLFNIQGLLWKLFNLKPVFAGNTQQPTTLQPTTLQPTTTPQTQVDDYQLPFFLNFNDIFSDTAPTTAAPVVETTQQPTTQQPTTQQPTTTPQPQVDDYQFPFFLSLNDILSDTSPTTAAPFETITAAPVVETTTAAPATNKDYFGDCGNGNSRRHCGPSLPNLLDVIYNILNIKPSNTVQPKTTEAPKTTTLESQGSQGQNVPSQVFREVFPMLDFQAFLPNVAKIFPSVQQNVKKPEQNDRVRNSYIVENVNLVPSLSQEQEEKYKGQQKNNNRLSTLSGNSVDGVKSFLENLNLLK